MSVLIYAASDVHGAIERLYDDVLASEVALGVRFDWMLHVGGFGIWPDPERIDCGACNHDGDPEVDVLARPRGLPTYEGRGIEL